MTKSTYIGGSLGFLRSAPIPVKLNSLNLLFTVREQTNSWRSCSSHSLKKHPSPPTPPHRVLRLFKNIGISVVLTKLIAAGIRTVWPFQTKTLYSCQIQNLIVFKPHLHVNWSIQQEHLKTKGGVRITLKCHRSVRLTNQNEHAFSSTNQVQNQSQSWLVSCFEF